MNFARSLAVSILLAMSLIGCDKPDGAKPETDPAPPVYGDQTGGETPRDVDTSSMVSAYYAGQEDKAFQMLHKHIFQNVLETSPEMEGIKNPQWEFDSFARYHEVDQDMRPNSEGGQLYTCAYSADEDRYGYFVFLYLEDGPALSKVKAVETPYLYDLQANIDAVSAELAQTELDFASTTASRISVVGPGQEQEEAILFTDDSGNRYTFYFAEPTN